MRKKQYRIIAMSITIILILIFIVKYLTTMNLAQSIIFLIAGVLFDLCSDFLIQGS